MWWWSLLGKLMERPVLTMQVEYEGIWQVSE